MVTYADLTLDSADALMPDSEARDLLRNLRARRDSVQVEHQRFLEMCERMDRLYYAETTTQWGADLWPQDASATTPGRSHVSVNSAEAYVNIPAALQSVEPIENVLPTALTQEARDAAADLERVRYAWKRKEKWNLKRHKAITSKGLYGHSAARIYWKDKQGDEIGYPCVEIIDQPRNLYLGWKTDAYDELTWAAYVQRMSPMAVVEEFSVELELREVGGDKRGIFVPYVVVPETTYDSMPTRPWLNYGTAMIEVWDHWFLKQAGDLGTLGKKTKMVVVNAVFVGNALVRYAEHPEFDGELPIKPLFNTYIPGVPDGRPDLYDMEQLFHETNARITAGAQMIHSATAGNYWQVVGPETTQGKVDPAFKPVLNQVIVPGQGARVEVIQPFIAQFQLEQYLTRIDQYKEEISGLNPLLLGRAPLQSLSSSKAVNALIANYETRLSMRRALNYEWDVEIWELVVKVWAYKSDDIKAIITAGGGTLDLTDPSLNPRDEMETMQRAINAKDHQIWSPERAMDATGVDDPEEEMNLIRAANTDATLNPALVGQMVVLLQQLQSAGVQAPQGVQAQAGAQQNALRGALGGPTGTVGTQDASEQGITPPEGLVPGATPPGGGEPFITAQGGQPQTGQVQSMITGPGQVSSRVLTQRKFTPLGKRG